MYRNFLYYVYLLLFNPSHSNIFADYENDLPIKPLLNVSFSAYFFPDGEQMLGNAWDIGFRKGYLTYNKNGYIYGYHSNIYLMPELRLG
jgi:hypothetical protein